MSDRLTHTDDDGRASMVDVGDKAVTDRIAVAHAVVEMGTATADMVFAGSVPKGDAIAVARVAGIQGAKATPTLIPLCHPLPLSSVTVEIERVERGARISCTARVSAKTGVEMEALTGVSVAALTLYDMIKGVDRLARITDVELVSKSGGRSGDWSR